MTTRDRFARFSSTHELRRNLKGRSIRGALYVASGNMADVGIRVVSIAVLARILFPEDFGLIAMVAAFTGVVDSFRDFGLSAATVQRADISHQQVSNLFWINALIGALLGAGLAAAAPLIATFYDDQRLVGICIALGSVFIWSGLSVQHEALMNRQLRQGELALIRLLASVTSVVVAVGLALDGWGYWSLVWREIVRAALITAGAWLRCAWLPGFPRRHAGTRSLVRFGGELSATNLLVGLIAHFDKLLVGRIYGAGVVGMYRQAQQLILAPIEQLNVPIMSTAQPALSALQADPSRYRRYYDRITFLVAMATFPFGLFLAVCAEEVTFILLGPAWADAAIFVRIFGIAAAVRPAIATSAVVLITCGRSTRFLTLAVIHSALLALSLLIGSRWGAAGVALGHVVATLLFMYPKLYYSFKDTPATLAGFFGAIKAPVVAGSVMTGCLLIVQQFSPEGAILSLGVSMLAGAASYLAVMYMQPHARAQLASLLADVSDALGKRQASANVREA